MGNVSNWIDRNRTVDATVLEGSDEDARLMCRFRDGDAGAFDQLFQRHARALINYAYRFVQNRAHAEELAQEVFLKVYEGAGRYKVKAKFTTWLYRIATNICLNEIRKTSFRAVHQSLTMDSSKNSEYTPRELQSVSDAIRNLDQEAIARALKQALSQIPEKQRVAFILNKYQELSYAEVGEIMKISEKAVKSLIHRAREALAERLKPVLPGRI